MTSVHITVYLFPPIGIIPPDAVTLLLQGQLLTETSTITILIALSRSDYRTDKRGVPNLIT
jgi:hypothetical protein